MIGADGDLTSDEPRTLISIGLQIPANLVRLGSAVDADDFSILDRERDRISPLKISVDAWKRMRTFFNVPAEELQEMIRRTHQLVFFRPAFRTTLARYDAKKNKAMKASTLEKAASELYTKAHLDLPEVEKEKLERLLKSIAAGK